MTVRLNPYLAFPEGNAREAMEFYQSVFGGELALSTFGDFGAPDPALAGKVMHAMLTTEQGFTLMGSDPAPGMAVTPGTTMSVSLSGDESELIRGWWERLSEGGTVSVPLEKQMWGDEFGTCRDRFGTEWMVNMAAAT